MPILHANSQPDLREASRLDAALRVTLVDMASIRRVAGTIEFLGVVNGGRTDTGRVRFVGLGGADAFQATGSEDTDVVETPLAQSGLDVQVVRQALVRNIGDLVDMTASGTGDITPERLAQDMVMSYERRFTDLWATAITTATTTVGTSGADFVHDDFKDGVFTLEIADVPGPWFSGFHARQMADWQESLGAEAGALQFRDDTSAMLEIKGQGFQGRMLNVDVWRFSHVQNDGTNRQGGMWGAGAFGFRIGIPNPRTGAGSALAVRMDELAVELTRNASRAITEVAGNAWVGLQVIEQARLVEIATGA